MCGNDAAEVDPVDQHWREQDVQTATKTLVLRSNTKKATPNTEWLYALERSTEGDENTVNIGVSETPKKAEDLIKDPLPNLPSDLLALAAQLANLPEAIREGLATLLKTISPPSTEQKKG